RDGRDDDRLRRHHAARRLGQDRRHLRDDHRHLAFRAARAGDLQAAQGLLPLPQLRPAAARSRCGALQSLRHAAQHPRRGRDMTPAVKAKFATYAPAQRRQLEAMRALVLDVARATAGVGAIEETLKWGQPSYLTPETKSGTTIRIDAHPSGGAAMYVN